MKEFTAEVQELQAHNLPLGFIKHLLLKKDLNLVLNYAFSPFSLCGILATCLVLKYLVFLCLLRFSEVFQSVPLHPSHRPQGPTEPWRGRQVTGRAAVFGDICTVGCTIFGKSSNYEI